MLRFQIPDIIAFAQVRIYQLQLAIKDQRIPRFINGRSTEVSYNYLIAQYNLVITNSNWWLYNLDTLFSGSNANLIPEHAQTESAEIQRFKANPLHYLQTHPNYVALNKR